MGLQWWHCSVVVYWVVVVGGAGGVGGLLVGMGEIVLPLVEGP